MNRPKVSIILPTYRREELLCRTLGDLLQLDYPDYELIVVDQTPLHLPETQRYLHGIKSRILYLRQERPSQVAAANAGAKVAGGEIVLFVDDDIRIPDRDFIWFHARDYEDPTIGGVAGRILDARDLTKAQFNPLSDDPTRDPRTLCEVTAAGGANMSFRRELIMRLGGFDERFLGNAFRWEDDFCLRVQKAGYRVVYDPKPTVHHFYGSTGGNENYHLLGRDPASHGWYRFFFHNQMYFALKHMPGPSLPRLLWRLYRNHVMNRSCAREGMRFLVARHWTFAAGLAHGIATYRQWRREVLP